MSIMTSKDKLILALLSIITIGIYPLVIYRKRQDTAPKDTLSYEEKINVDVEELLKNLGSKENVAGVEFTHTKVKIFILERAKVNVDAIMKQKGISGVYATTKFVTVIVGNSAKALSEKLI